MSIVNIDVTQPTTVTNIEATISVAGPAGADGTDGTNGARWYQGSGAPSTVHNDGDFYIDATNGDVYEQVSGAWGSPIINLRGPAGSGTGDMLASVYDPTSKAADAFSMGNMAETTTKKIMTDTERTKLSGIAAGADVTGTTNVAAAGAFMKATDTLDAITDGTTYKKYSSTEKTKLAGIATGADVTNATSVDAAGAVMNSDTTTASMGFVVDEDDMVSNSATKLPTQQSVKAYVDTKTTGLGTGNVTGASGSVAHELVAFADTSGTVLERATGLTYDSSTGTITNASGATLAADATHNASLKSGTVSLSVNQSTGATLTGGPFNGRINTRATGFAATTTPDVSAADMYHYQSLSVNIAINAPVGSPVTGNKLLFAFKDNGTSRSITWDAIFKPIGVTIPTATTPNKWTYVGAVYNTAVAAWHVIAVSQEA